MLLVMKYSFSKLKMPLVTKNSFGKLMVLLVTKVYRVLEKFSGR